MTNFEYIKSLPVELLAIYLVNDDWPVWRTSDGRAYNKYGNAMKHEIEWLKKEFEIIE